jgi:hypothetical protein
VAVISSARPDSGENAGMTTMHQVRVSLQGVEPEVWRRLLLPSDVTMDEAIWLMLAGMGWEIYHLYDLRLGEVAYGMPDEDFNASIADAREVVLGNALTAGDRLVLSYDYGDGWEHDVVVETVVPMQGGPRCVDGAAACPPEDCGGPDGYQHLLEVLANPGHDEYADLAGWAGGFDASAFNAGKATKAMLVALKAQRKHAYRNR